MRFGPPTKRLISTQQKHILELNNQLGGCTIRTLDSLLKKQPFTDYLVRYRDQEHRSPSHQTIWRLLHNEQLITKTIRTRPFLSDANKLERLDWCEDRIIDVFKEMNIDDAPARERFARTLETIVDVDEMYLVFSAGTGKLYFFPEDVSKLDAKERSIIHDEWKQNPPKILLFGAVTAPHLLNPRTSHLEGAQFDEKKRGIIQLRRVRAVSKYQRNTKNHQKGELKFSNCSITGQIFKHMMTGPKGLADFLDKYYNDTEDDGLRTTAWGIPLETMFKGDSPVAKKGEADAEPPSKLIRIQQDNAGGHGFNNLRGGAPTESQMRMVQEMRDRGYIVYRQPRNSPEFNMLDLGFWNSIKQAVRQRAPELRKLSQPTENQMQAALWTIVKEVVASYEPSKLFSIAVQKQVMMHECILSKGGVISKEVHSGVRKFWGL